MLTFLLSLLQVAPLPASPVLDYLPTTPGASVMQQTIAAAPELLSVERHGTHCAVTWACSPDATTFQLMRRSGSATNVPFAQRIERIDPGFKFSFVAADPRRLRFTYVDKRLERDAVYYYSVLVVEPAAAAGGESNVLEIKP